MTHDGQHLRDLAVSDSGFVFDPRTGATFSVNPTGLALLRGLMQGLERARLVGALDEGFEVDGADLDRDVDEFVEQLRAVGIVGPEFAP